MSKKKFALDTLKHTVLMTNALHAESMSAPHELCAYECKMALLGCALLLLLGTAALLTLCRMRRRKRQASIKVRPRISPIRARILPVHGFSN